MTYRSVNFWYILVLVFLQAACNSKDLGGEPTPPGYQAGPAIAYWVTKGDQSALLQKQTTPLSFGSPTNNFSTIEIDTATTFQAMDGFGFTLTGGSAELIDQMPQAEQAALLREL